MKRISGLTLAHTVDVFLFILGFGAALLWMTNLESPLAAAWGQIRWAAGNKTWSRFPHSMSHEMREQNLSGAPPGPHRRGQGAEGMLSGVISSKVRVLCMIFSHQKNHRKAETVNMTWGQHCTEHVFMSSTPVGALPTVTLPVVDEWKFLWNKTKESFKWAYRHRATEFDWFLKADDDTYAVMENMRYLLSFYDPEEPWYLGCRFTPYVKRGYMSGGAGYILSNKAVKLLVEVGLSDLTHCDQGVSGAEDVQMGACLDTLGVFYGDSRDEKKHWRFFPFKFSSFFTYSDIPSDMWYWSYIYYNITLDMNCCSDTAISAHYVAENKMFLYHYLLYHIQLPGRKESIEYLSPKIFG